MFISKNSSSFQWSDKTFIYARSVNKESESEELQQQNWLTIHKETWNYTKIRWKIYCFNDQFMWIRMGVQPHIHTHRHIKISNRHDLFSHWMCYKLWTLNMLAGLDFYPSSRSLNETWLNHFQNFAIFSFENEFASRIPHMPLHWSEL